VGLPGDGKLAVVVTVVAVGMVQVPVNEVVDVIAMRDGVVAASGPVRVSGLVLLRRLGRCASVRVLVVDGDPMFIHVVLVRMMKMSVMEVVDVPVMAHSGVTARGAVLVIVIRVDGVLILSHTGSLALVGVGATLDAASAMT
jgi:hypothetical protein